MLEKEDFVKTVRRLYPPFYVSIIMEGYHNERNWSDFLGFNYGIHNLVVTNGIWYYPKYHVVSFSEKLTKKLFSDSKLFKKIKEETTIREKKLKNVQDMNLKTFCSSYSNYMPTLGIYFICDDWIEQKIKETLLENFSKKQVEKIINILIVPYKDNLSRKSQIELIRTKNIHSFIKKYGWMKARYGNIKRYNKNDVKKLLEKLEKENFEKKYEKDKELKKKTINKVKKVLGVKSYLVDIMQQFIYYRTHRTDIMNKIAFEFIPKLKIIANEKGLTYKELIFCTKKEFENPPSKKILQERMKEFTFVGEGKSYYILEGEEHRKIKKKFETKEKTNEVKGAVAFKGNIKGIARIIKTKEDYSKLKQNDILVTFMTTPEMVPLMEKAAAFVTDEGGITCHASIIARELGKPCIIGTKNATEVFKDGDIIEVDANKGLVRKI